MRAESHPVEVPVRIDSSRRSSTMPGDVLVVKRPVQIVRAARVLVQPSLSRSRVRGLDHSHAERFGATLPVLAVWETQRDRPRTARSRAIVSPGFSTGGLIAACRRSSVASCPPGDREIRRAAESARRYVESSVRNRDLGPVLPDTTTTVPRTDPAPSHRRQDRAPTRLRRDAADRPGHLGRAADRDECVRVVQRAVELGVDFIDTADSYGPYVSEEILRRGAAPVPGAGAIATKAGFVRTGPSRWMWSDARSTCARRSR